MKNAVKPGKRAAKRAVSVCLASLACAAMAMAAIIARFDTGAPAINRPKSFPIESLQQAVNSSDVHLIRTTEKLPPGVRAWFQERADHAMHPSFTFARPKMIDMANSGQPWDGGCVIQAGIPRRQLNFAGVTDDRCFVVFRSGGFAESQNVALFCLINGQALFAGTTYATGNCGSLAALRKMVRSKVFRGWAERASASY